VVKLKTKLMDGPENIKPCDKAGDVAPDDADDLKT
jgi:hypothetical protein